MMLSPPFYQRTRYRGGASPNTRETAPDRSEPFTLFASTTTWSPLAGSHLTLLADRTEPEV
jgi:hypothetical protein